MTIAIYARVSTKDKGQDTENQLLALRKHARKIGTSFIEYVENVSGAAKTRPRFEEMMTAAYQRKIDMVLFWSLDRFSREGIEATLKHLRYLNDHKVTWKSYTEPFLDSSGPMGEMIVAVIAAIAAQERVRFRERVLAGLEKVKVSGTKSGKSIGRQKAIYRRDLAQQMRQEGKSIREIARALSVAPSVIARGLEAVPQPLSVLASLEGLSVASEGLSASVPQMSL